MKPIPLNIVIEILSRLPARSLVRFRRVCKLWRSITHDPRFIDTHLERARNVILLFEKSWDRYEISILDNTGSTKRLLSRPSPHFRGIFSMSESCNGLLCIYGTDGSVEVMNPATGESFIPPDTTKTGINGMAFLGFHPVTKDYKIVRFFSNFGRRCEVHTLGTSSWRQICNPDDFFPSTLAATVKGVMYLANWDHDVIVSVISFDFKDEIFTPISIPNFEVYQGVNYRVHDDLVELQGSVCMSVFQHDDLVLAGPMDIWMLSTKHEWTRKYSVTSTFKYPYPRPLLIHNEKILVRNVMFSSPHDHFKPITMLQYHHLNNNNNNNNNNKSEEVYRDNDHHCLGAFVHVESLVAILQNRS